PSSSGRRRIRATSPRKASPVARPSPPDRAESTRARLAIASAPAEFRSRSTCAPAIMSVRRHLAGLGTTSTSDGISRDRATPVPALARFDALSRLFDIAFLIPGTNVRFGIEAVLRLVPGIGDAAASALSCYLLYEAPRLGVPTRIFARMVLNVAIEGIV